MHILHDTYYYILPEIHYLEESYREKFSCENLAKYCKIHLVEVAREISAVQNFFINKQSCSALSQCRISPVHYLKFSEQRYFSTVQLRKPFFLEQKQNCSELRCFRVDQPLFSPNQRCSPLVEIHHALVEKH